MAFTKSKMKRAGSIFDGVKTLRSYFLEALVKYILQFLTYVVRFIELDGIFV